MQHVDIFLFCCYVFSSSPFHYPSKQVTHCCGQEGSAIVVESEASDSFKRLKKKEEKKKDHPHWDSLLNSCHCLEEESTGLPFADSIHPTPTYLLTYLVTNLLESSLCHETPPNYLVLKLGFVHDHEGDSEGMGLHTRRHNGNNDLKQATVGYHERVGLTTISFFVGFCFFLTLVTKDLSLSLSFFFHPSIHPFTQAQQQSGHSACLLAH